MTMDDKIPIQPGKLHRKRVALWLVAAGAAIWLGFAISDSFKDPTPSPAPKVLKSLALRHLQAESENAFWTGGGR